MGNRTPQRSLVLSSVDVDASVLDDIEEVTADLRNLISQTAAVAIRAEQVILTFEEAVGPQLVDDDDLAVALDRGGVRGMFAALEEIADHARWLGGGGQRPEFPPAA